MWCFVMIFFILFQTSIKAAELKNEKTEEKRRRNRNIWLKRGSVSASAQLLSLVQEIIIFQTFQDHGSWPGVVSPRLMGVCHVVYSVGRLNSSYTLTGGCHDVGTVSSRCIFL